jgi:hypothetical protein
MTNDERYIIKLNIAHYQAMLKLGIDDEKRSVIERLLAEAEEVLTTASKENSRPDIATKKGTARVPSTASKRETGPASAIPASTLPESLATAEIGTQYPSKLREPASWYREFADRAGNPAIWDARLRMAQDLDAEVERSERRLAAASRVTGRFPG